MPGQNELVYLDYNATAPIRPSVIDAVTAAMSVGGNPSSVHQHGRRARGIAEKARTQVAALVGARPRDVVFMSGGTEANNAALRMTGATSLIVSAVEHDCIFAAAKASGLDVQICPVDREGIIDLVSLERLLSEADGTPLVSVMLANNETGVIQPVAEVADLAHSHGAKCHTDAVQAAGKLDVDFKALGVEYLSLSAHKLGGPQGVGALVLGPTAPLAPLITGGGQELGRRSGTENVAGIAGFGQAAMDAMVGLDDYAKLARMRNEAEAALLKAGYQIAGSGADRLANTICAIAPAMKGETQVMAFDLAGVCISSGSACSSGKVKTSHVLEAMGMTHEKASRSIRISLGYDTTEKDIERFCESVAQVAGTRARKAAHHV